MPEARSGPPSRPAPSSHSGPPEARRETEELPFRDASHHRGQSLPRLAARTRRGRIAEREGDTGHRSPAYPARAVLAWPATGCWTALPRACVASNGACRGCVCPRRCSGRSGRRSSRFGEERVGAVADAGVGGPGGPFEECDSAGGEPGDVGVGASGALLLEQTRELPAGPRSWRFLGRRGWLVSLGGGRGRGRGSCRRAGRVR